MSMISTIYVFGILQKYYTYHLPDMCEYYCYSIHISDYIQSHWVPDNINFNLCTYVICSTVIVFPLAKECIVSASFLTCFFIKFLLLFAAIHTPKNLVDSSLFSR